MTVLYRHGFYASEQLVPLDRREFVTSARVYRAGQYGSRIEDIKLTLKPPRLAGDAAREAVLEMHVDLSRVTFTRANDRYTAKQSLVVFAGDAKEAVVGETWRTLELSVNEANRERLLREGTPVTVTIPVPATARGTATARIR